MSSMPDSLTHSLTTLKDSATQLLIKYKSGALVTQLPLVILVILIKRQTLSHVCTIVGFQLNYFLCDLQN